MNKITKEDFNIIIKEAESVNNRIRKDHTSHRDFIRWNIIDRLIWNCKQIMENGLEEKEANND